MCNSCKQLLAKLDEPTIIYLMRGERAAAKIEQKGFAKIDRVLSELEDQAVRDLMEGKEKPPEPNFTPMLLEIIYQAMQAGFDVEPRLPKNTAKLSAGKPTKPPIKIPSNPKELRLWWDLVRHFKAPPRIQILADKIKWAYIRKVQSIWTKIGEDFREGKVWNQSIIREEMKKIVGVVRSRAHTIVATETTRYFNQATVNYYAKNSAITHYLFIAVRDHKTTPWCKTRQGLIYEKDSAVFIKEQPPCHWRCRSRVVPLSPFNPKHKLLIADKSIQRKNNKPAPLPEGWNE